MNQAEKIVDFTTRLGKELLSCGANLERVNLTIEAICKAYEVKDYGLHSLSTMISLSVTDKDNNIATKTIKTVPLALNMEKLRLLTEMYKKIIKEKPSIDTLNNMLDEAISKVKYHPQWVVFIGYMVALISLSRLFGGGIKEIIVASITTVFLYFMGKLFTRMCINKILVNFISMFLSGLICIIFTRIGFLENIYVVILTNAFFLIPGIPLVNSVRSLICGNEMNGIIELIKVCIETIAIIAGTGAMMFMFESMIPIKIEDTFAVADFTNILYDLELLVLSFLVSAGFGITFNIPWKETLYVGFGAILVRLVYVLCLYSMPDYRFICVVLAAISADVFSEVLVLFKKRPATYYLYTFIIPLIPGDLFVYTMFGIIWKNKNLFNANVGPCILSLLGISIGCVVASCVMHYVRKIKLHKLMAK